MCYFKVVFRQGELAESPGKHPAIGCFCSWFQLLYTSRVDFISVDIGFTFDLVICW